MIINLTINGIEKRIDVELDAYLLDVLRETGLNSVRRACDTSTCGICTVLLDDKPVLSCSVLAVRADGHSIITIEGIAKEAEKIADLMTKEGSEQCGFCSSGLVLNIYSMRNELKNLSDDEIRERLVGNLCRCSGYMAQQRAITKYLEVLKNETQI